MAAGVLVGLLVWPYAAPAAAQGSREPPSLKDLIPDSAVNKPEAWAKAPSALPAGTLGDDAFAVPFAIAPAVAKPPAGKAGNDAAAAAAPAVGEPTVSARFATAPQPAAEVIPGVATAATQLRPDSPMADIAGLSLPWPEGEQAFPALTPLEADAGAADEFKQAMASLPGAPVAGPSTAAPTHIAKDTVLAGGRERLEWSGDPAAVPDREALETRFRTLTAMQGLNPKDADALAQVGARGAADRKMLEKLLRIYGYYDGEVTQTLIVPGDEAKGAGASVHFLIDAGSRYKIGAITTGDLEQTGRDYPTLFASLALKRGDPLALDAITAGAAALTTKLGETGYPFAQVAPPSLTVDHAAFSGDIDLAVRSGGKYRYGALTSNLPRFLSPHHLGEIARFRKGQTYRQSEVEDLRHAVLATGIASGVSVTPREAVAPVGERPGVVALDVVLSKAPVHTITGEVGYDTGEGFNVAASWEHRNLFPPEGALKIRGILGTNEQLAGVTFRRSNFLGRDRVLSVDIYADNANLSAYAARKVAFVVNYERQTNAVFQKPWTWSLGLEVQASEEREGIPNGVVTGRTLYVTTALPLRGGSDGTNDLLDPVRGHRASLRFSPEISTARGVQSGYVRVQGDISGYWPVVDAVLLAGRVRLGSMPGTAIDNVAPSRRFYAGGGASIRGYGYELVGPRNALGEPKGGRSLYEFSLEARTHTGLFAGALDVVPFLDAGGVETGTVARFNDWRFGAGLGIRYRTGFGPIRIDVGTPLNPRAGDGPVGVYVALGQAF